jgi:hypothetical protein
MVVCALTENLFQVVMRQLGYFKVCYRGQMENSGLNREAICTFQSQAGISSFDANNK